MRFGFFTDRMPAALTYQCPFCDRQVRVGRPCPGCAKKKRGPVRKPAPKSWERDSAADGLDLPDDDFDYEDFIDREFGHAPQRRTGVKWYWWLLAVAVLAAMLAGLLQGWP